MDKRELVNEIRKVIDVIIADKEYVNFVMLLPDDNNKSFTVLIGAKWLNELSPYEGVKLIYSYFINEMANEQLKCISRINLIHTADKAIGAIYQAFCMRGGVLEINNCDFFGVYIKSAYILESHRGRKC